MKIEGVSFHSKTLGLWWYSTFKKHLQISRLILTVNLVFLNCSHSAELAFDSVYISFLEEDPGFSASFLDITGRALVLLFSPGTRSVIHYSLFWNLYFAENKTLIVIETFFFCFFRHSIFGWYLARIFILVISCNHFSLLKGANNSGVISLCEQEDEYV